jgi:RNA polymerase sigma-70 factor (ECF subfamily)
LTTDPDASEADLLERAREGNDSAFRILFERHAELLTARIQHRLPARLSRKLSVSDVLQETRIVAHERCLDFDPGRGPFRNWLLGIVDMKVREASRRFDGTSKRAAGREISRGGRVDTENFMGRGPSPSEVAATAELRERARRAREQLPEDYAEILRLTFDEGLTLGEAGERMGRSREAAKKLYGRALCRFKEVYQSLGGGGDG